MYLTLYLVTRTFRPDIAVGEIIEKGDIPLFKILNYLP